MSKNKFYNEGVVSLKPEYKLVDGEIKKIVAFVAHTYQIDPYDPQGVDDPMLKKWLVTDEAQYIIKHSVKTPTVQKYRAHDTYEECCKVIAYMYDEHVVFYTLKWK
jgi:hypothetical protein